MRWWLFCLLFLVISSGAFAGGSLEDIEFYSESLGFDRSARVYLPEGYDPDGNTAYPVVYFLHGSTYGYPFYWSYWNLQEVLDELIASGDIPHIIFVTPDGLIGPYTGSYWSNSELYGNFEDFVAFDLVEYMDTHYRTAPRKEFRGLHGLSMGGYGVMKMGLKHSDTFCSIASHSGPIALDVSVECSREPVMQEYPEYPDGPYNYSPTAGFMSGLMFVRSGGFSPNLDNPPYYVDLPMDEWGGVASSVMDRWRYHDPCYLARALPPDHGLSIFFDCGTQDPYCAYEAALAFRDTLDVLEIAYEFEDFVGGHADHFAERFPIGLTRLMQKIPSPVAFDLKPGSCPNPLNPAVPGVLPAAILGTMGIDVTTIDLSTVLLEGIVAPLQSSLEDVATPIVGDPCDCTMEGLDGWGDLTLKFAMEDVVAVLGPVEDGEVRELTITGQFTDGSAFEGTDCMVIRLKRGEQALPRLVSLPAEDGTSRIQYALDEASLVNLAIYDVLGRQVRQLAQGLQPAGSHESAWDGRDDGGRALPSGVYFYRLEASGSTRVERTVLIR